MTTESNPTPETPPALSDEPAEPRVEPEEDDSASAEGDNAADESDGATADTGAAPAPPAPTPLEEDAGLTAAEREYQAALRAAQSLGLDVETPTDDQPDEEAGRLAARLGLDQPVAEEPAPEGPNIFAEEAPDAEAEPAEGEEEDEFSNEPADGRAWYVLNTYSGQESRVKKNLDRRVKSMDVADKIFRVIVPTEDELEIRGGQRKQVQRKLLPGYVLVEMILDDDTYYVVRGTPSVTGFVGTEHPVPLPREEVRSILKQMKTGAAEPRIRVGFEVGDSVRVIEGPFQEFMGEVDEINLEKGKVRILISMFGRETPVDLEFSQVEKV